MDVVTLGAALNGAKKYTDTSVQALMGGVRYKGEVNYYNNLPNDAEEGDAYTVKYSGTSGSDPDGGEYVWGKDQQGDFGWRDFSKDRYTKTETNSLLSGKQNTIDNGHKLNADLVDDSNATHKFVTATEKTQISDTAEKAAGIAETDDNYIEMENGVRLYISSTVPTGDIPEGSLGIGW